ncbi:MAG: helix-turn-helix domain-containing protein [archaeon]
MPYTEMEVLEDLGLSEAEARVYLSLLELGSTLAGPVIKKTGLHRGTTYQILQRLQEKGLVSSIIKGKKQHFAAAPPEQFKDMLKEKEEKLDSILPELALKAKLSIEKQDVTVYSGVNGIRAVLDKMLDELGSKGEYSDFGVSGLFKEVMGPYWELWQKRKKKLGITSQVIFNEDVKKKSPELLQNYVGEARFHPREFASITDTMIYNNNVILFIWTARPPIAIVICNKENADSYRNQFLLMWKYALKE